MSTQHLFGDSSHPAGNGNPANPSANANPDAGAKGKDAVRITSHNQYTSPHLARTDMDPSPFAQFRDWFDSANKPGPDQVREPEAMCISTVSSSGYPSSRMVLMRGADDRGFTFFTNYTSRKSGELADNQGIAVCWYWKEASRQIRVVGKVEKVDRKESAEYFASRPRGSQIGAWASEQSKAIGEDTMRERIQELEKKWEGKDVECPEHWGGWKIIPQ